MARDQNYFTVWTKFKMIYSRSFCLRFPFSVCMCKPTSTSNIWSTPNLRDHIVCVLGCSRCNTQLELTSDCWRICIYTSSWSHPWNVSADNGTALICKAGKRVTRRPACRKISTSEIIWLSICSLFAASSASTSRDCNKVAGIYLVMLFSRSISSWTKWSSLRLWALLILCSVDS